jgi:hypothetical protein
MPVNVNDFSGQMLETYQSLGRYPKDGDLSDRLYKLYRLVAECQDEYEGVRKYGRPLIYGTCAIRPEDCAAWSSCQEDGKGDTYTCAPEGLAFRLGDVVLLGMSIMQELGIDVDAVLTAQYQYLKQKVIKNED